MHRRATLFAKPCRPSNSMSRRPADACFGDLVFACRWRSHENEACKFVVALLWPQLSKPLITALEAVVVPPGHQLVTPLAVVGVDGPGSLGSQLRRAGPAIAVARSARPACCPTARSAPCRRVHGRGGMASGPVPESNRRRRTLGRADVFTEGARRPRSPVWPSGLVCCPSALARFENHSQPRRHSPQRRPRGAFKLTLARACFEHLRSLILRFPGDTGLEGGSLDGGSDALDHLAVEDAGHDVFGAQFTRRDAVGNGARGRLLHALGDLRGAHVQGAAEDAREGQHVVDLVGVIAAAGGHDEGVRAPLPRA